jgi:hypothetical protein
MLHQAFTLGGQKWGDIIYRQEMYALSRMSETEKAALAAKKAKEEAEAEKNRVDYTVNLRKKLYTSAEGLAKRKFNRMCKKERFEGGCYLHSEKHGSCSFIHADERSRYETIFAGFGMKMLDDTAYLAHLSAADKASGAEKWKMEKESEQMEMDLKRQARCLFVIGVSPTGDLNFSRTAPEQRDDRSSNSGRKPSGFGNRCAPLPAAPQRSPWQQKTVDNSAW